MSQAPAKRACASCPYRKDVPSGVWAESEYDKLPPYDADTADQPMGVFMCHQQNGRVCAGWAGCHDMTENIALRLAPLTGSMSPDDVAACLDYESPVPLFESGQAASDHGKAEIPDPSDKAQRTIEKVARKRAASGRPTRQ
jgi:hypothetical protein